MGNYSSALGWVRKSPAPKGISLFLKCKGITEGLGGCLADCVGL